MIPTGEAVFVIEAAEPEPPRIDPSKETKQCCPLCHEMKKLKVFRDHVGLHILWHLLGVEETLITLVRHPLLLLNADA